MRSAFEIIYALGYGLPRLRGGCRMDVVAQIGELSLRGLALLSSGLRTLNLPDGGIGIQADEMTHPMRASSVSYG